MGSSLIAIGLQTCGREAHTKRTLDTLVAHNPDLRERFLLLHADDGSETEENILLASRAGFATCFAPHERQGQIAGLRRLLAEAERLGARHFLYLEGDWESARPIPDLPQALLYDCFRLYGTMKARQGARSQTGCLNMVTGEPICWTWAGDGLEWSPSCHWAGPPSITRLEILKQSVDKCSSVKEVAKTLSLPTLRVTNNVFWHVADGTTPGFKP